MSTVAEISLWMDGIAPLGLSESWDNTGLLFGDWQAEVQRVMTCLSLTPITVREAVEEGADLVVAHHPLPFQPLKRITTQTTSGKLLLRLAAASISIYSPHTAWDSAQVGINALLADKLKLREVVSLIPADPQRFAGLGSGRAGCLASTQSLAEIIRNMRRCIPDCRPHGVDSGKPIRRVAVACGSGGSLLSAAIHQDCDLFVTGEATFHTCLEAQACGLSLVLLGHFASERFSMEHLAQLLGNAHPELSVWTSRLEKDPITDFEGITG